VTTSAELTGWIAWERFKAAQGKPQRDAAAVPVMRGLA
jgi:hypothetical protein